ncbi:porin family protein [Capnocytophaga canimorsus]|uniref:porin family protein n=1 Tax=Capnocytophaga canimorsus TaxID=28188 RepID=UPI000F6FCCE2|nr:porin family protein [Capnocytophaga canimorsus]GIM57660.1 hypothetical protein CAPN006_20520 [Capnocytophaga canimorsus]VEJ18370.1 Uncharacterised protein [Capnocytophaga canimorsus]
MKQIIKLSFFILFLWSLPIVVSAQNDDDDGLVQIAPKEELPQQTNKKYLEDQFYLGLTYDLMAIAPDDVVQHSLSRGILFGFIKDIPLNKSRTIGVAAGLGYSYDLIYSNIVGIRTPEATQYSIVSSLKEANLSKNYFEYQCIELPIEFRWRTSTKKSHKFWRVYTGMRIGYVVSSENLFKKDDLNISFQNPDLNRKWHFKVFTAFGYNALNFFVQYNFTPLFKGVKTSDNTSLDTNILQMGLMFYIL